MLSTFLAESRKRAGQTPAQGEHAGILEEAIAQAEQALVITDAELDYPGPRIVFVNPAFTTITGYEADEVVGLTPRLLQGPLTERSELDRMRKELNDKGSFQGQTWNYKKDGTAFVLDWKVSAIVDHAGAVTHYVALQQDVTADIRAREVHADASKLAAAARLTAGIAHDFNNLLGALTGLAHTLSDQLADEAGDSEEARDTAKEIIATVDRAALLTRQMQLIGQRTSREQSEISLNRVVLGVENLLRRFVESGVSLKVEVPGSEITVRAAVSDVERMLINLVANANGAMPRGGTIEIKLERVCLNKGEALAYGGREGEYAALWVKDTGLGMDEATKSRIFEPFFTTKREGEGMGLGLANVYHWVRELHGVIAVTSEPGHGSRFGIHLPLYSPKQMAGGSGAS